MFQVKNLVLYFFFLVLRIFPDFIQILSIKEVESPRVFLKKALNLS